MSWPRAVSTTRLTPFTGVPLEEGHLLGDDSRDGAVLASTRGEAFEQPEELAEE
jgi:hypothetical protein